MSSKAQSGDIIVIDELKAAEYKTKTVVNMLTAIGADKKALIVTPAVDAKLVKSAANIPGVKTATADSINTYEVLNGGKFVISVDAAKKLERYLRNENSRAGHHPRPGHTEASMLASR